MNVSAAYMRQWTGSALVQVMVWRLFGVKPLPELMLTTKVFIHENAFENVIFENDGRFSYRE